MPLLAFGDLRPCVDPTAWVAGSAELVGDVTLHADSSVWYQAVLRAELAPITLGEGSNLQDGCVVHTDEDFPTSIGARVSVGHRAVLHGCTIGDGALVGMGAVVLNGAVVGEECLIAAGAVVPEGMVVPPRTLVAGVPAKVLRELDDASLERVRANSVVYVELARQHRDTARPVVTGAAADGS